MMAEADSLLGEAACLSRRFPYPFPPMHIPSNPGHDSSHVDLETRNPGKKSEDQITPL